MTKSQILKLNSMRLTGAGVPQIAAELGVSYNTVASYIRRHPLPSDSTCKCCGQKFTMKPGRKKQKFCSQACKESWWNKHRYEQRKNIISKTCEFCGKEILCYESEKRKYCSRGCYHSARRLESNK